MNIVLRGDVLRECTLDIQKKAFLSIVTHVIKPLNLEDEEIKVIMVTYNNTCEECAKEIFKNYNFSHFIVKKKRTS